MTLIKLGEIVDKPQRKRIQMLERAADEQRQAAEARERDKAATAASAAEAQRQNGMNAKAYAVCAPLWRACASLETLEGASEATRSLAKRLQNRAELQLVVLDAEQIRRLPPGRFTAMGTSGMQPAEIRAVLHALITSGVQGAPATRFADMLKAKLPSLPDYVPPTGSEAFALPQSPTRSSPSPSQPIPIAPLGAAAQPVPPTPPTIQQHSHHHLHRRLHLRSRR